LRGDTPARVVLEHASEMRRQGREKEAVEAGRAGGHGTTGEDGRRGRPQEPQERPARRQTPPAPQPRRLFERPAQHVAQDASEATENERDTPPKNGYIFRR